MRMAGEKWEDRSVMSTVFRETKEKEKMLETPDMICVPFLSTNQGKAE